MRSTMSQPSYAPASPAVSVISPQFIVPYMYNVIVRRYASGILVVTDTNHKILITVKSCDSTLHTQRLLVDANERPIARLREKNTSAHDRWNAFRGESKADSDMIFSTVSNHMIQSKTHVNVFLANKASGRDDCDFKIKGNWSKRDCTIYMGNSSTIIAQIHKTDGNQSKDKFMVTIYPNVDYAFVITLIAMVDVMENNNTYVYAGAAAANGVSGCG
ncbi:protein LURP-one-related 10-like [Bidens hawaiensis]|uniref:protein LURP-one-related 10-like n=1 Tax=Bidens hawaiensis TaxID=980011 RepID=UPI00404B9ACB